MTYRFVIPGKPQPKQRTRKAGGRWYTPKKTKHYQTVVALAARAAGVMRIDGRVRLACDLYFPDRRRRDLDNCLKSIADGLNGIAYDDDSQIDEITARRHYDKANPRSEVLVERICPNSQNPPASAGGRGCRPGHSPN